VLPFSRTRAIRLQTPELAETVIDEATSLRNQAENLGLIGISPALDKFFIPQHGDQVHHVSGLRGLDPIYANTSPEQKMELQSILPSGHAIMNLMVMPAAIHQGNVKGASSIHNYLRTNGLEVSGKIDPNTFIGRAEAVRNSSFDEKKRLMEEYASDILPNIKDYMNDLYTEYDTGTALGEQSVNQKRFAAHPEVRKVLMQGLQEAELRDQALNASTRIGSEGDNRPRVVNIEAEGDVTIGDDVLGNGNGNGKRKGH